MSTEASTCRHCGSLIRHLEDSERPGEFAWWHVERVSGGRIWDQCQVYAEPTEATS